MFDDGWKWSRIATVMVCLVLVWPCFVRSATFNIDLSAGDVTINITGTVGDDTVNVTSPNTHTASGNWDGAGGTDTINWNGDGTLNATITNFEVLKKTGAGVWTLDTNLDLGASGAVTIDQGELVVLGGRTLTTNTLSLTGQDAVLDVQGTVTVGGGAGTVTGNNDYQVVAVFSTGVLNANVNLAGQDNEVYLMAGATVNGAIDGGPGDDDWLILLGPGVGTLTAPVSNFDLLVVDWGATWTLDTDVDVSGSGFGEASVGVGTLIIAPGRTLTTNLSLIGVNAPSTLTISATAVFNYDLLGVGPGSVMNVSGTANATDRTGVLGTVNVNSGGTLDGRETRVFADGLIIVNGGGTLNTTTTTIDAGGAFNLTGTSTATTSITVNGTAVVNGTLTSPTATVGATGNLGGTGQITGNVTNNGTMAPGTSIGTLNITGSYTHNAAATLEAEVNAGGGADLLNVTGGATINGGTLRIVRLAGVYTTGTRYVILQTTGGVAGTFGRVTGNTLRHIFIPIYEANRVLVQVTALSFEALMAGRSQNILSVAANLDTIVPNATGDLAAVIGYLDSLPSVEALANALGQLYGGHYNAFNLINFNIQNLFTAMSQTRLYQLRTGIPVSGGSTATFNPGLGPLLAYSGNLTKLGKIYSNDIDPTAMTGFTAYAGPATDVLRTAGLMNKRGVWVRPFGVFEDQDTVDGNAGYNYTTAGFSAGADFRFSPNFIAGISLGYASSRVKYDDAGGSSGDVQSYTAGVYGTYFTPKWFIEFSLAYARNTFDMKRKIVFTGVNREATSDYNGYAVTALLGGGYDFDLGRGWALGPVGSLEYVYQKQDGFTETGAGALNLTVGSQSANSFRAALGIRVRRTVQVDKTKFTFSLSALWIHEFANDSRGISSTMAGNPATRFTVNTPEPSRDALRLGIGLTARVSNRVALFVNYQPELRSDNTTHTISGGIRIEF